MVDFIQIDWEGQPFCADKEIYAVDVNKDER